MGPCATIWRRFFKSLFGGGQADIDCDASVFMLNQEGKLSGIKDLIYFGNLKVPVNQFCIQETI